MTHNELVLEHLKKYGTITPREADNLFACTRLAARINDLKRLGYRISKKIVREKNRFGEMSPHAIYKLEENDVQ